MEPLKVTLKQHTPLIHFQHEQDGATLRASEVKPKLDRFILNKLGGNNYKENYEKAKKNHWLVGKGEHPALDYKLRIKIIDSKADPSEYMIISGTAKVTSGNTQNIQILSNTPYFAQEKISVSQSKSDNPVILKHYNTGEFRNDIWNTIDKKGLIWNNTNKTSEIIELSFFTLKEGIKKLVQEHIASFFICTNFGTRSNKGFGSFTVIESGQEKKTEEIELILNKNYNFVYKRHIEAGNKIKNIFQAIKKDYQIIKSGFNFRDEYQKSLLFIYSVGNLPGKPRWEKRKMKQLIQPISKLHGDKKPIYGINDEENDWKDKPENYNYTFLRAVLGLAEQYEFRLAENNDKIIVKTNSCEDIQRFQSPLLFKVINNNIYLVGTEIDKRILNKKFSFHFQKKTEKGISNMVIKEDLSDKKKQNYHFTPEKFSLPEFMDFAMNYHDSKTNKKVLQYEKI